LELPAQRTDNAYPNAAEYTVTYSGERNYTHYYDKDTYTSLWVAYPLESKHIGSLDRPGSWSFNPLIDEKYQVDLCSRSYVDTYSRGHLIPDASVELILNLRYRVSYIVRLALHI
jgi:DNA/RNA endonuclease G (NUC1)